MVALQTIKDANSVLSLSEELTVAGLMLLIIFALVWHIKSIEKKHDKEKEILKQEVKDAQARLDREYKDSNEEMKKVIENYHVFTTRIFEKLNTLIK